MNDQIKKFSELSQEEINGMKASELGEMFGVPFNGKSRGKLIEAIKAKELDETIAPPVKELASKETPATIPISPDQSKLTPVQQQVSGYASTASKEPPRIEDVQDLFTRIEMEVPKGVSRGPEYDYAWLDVNGLSSINGSKWELVNRSNHSHVHDRVFDMSGGILYKGQNILAFCYREVREAEQAAIVKRYNDKTEKMTKTNEQAVEGTVQRVDPQGAGKVVNEVTIDPAAMDDF